MEEHELKPANYEYWFQVLGWDSLEAASLLLGIEPRSIPMMPEDQSTTQKQAEQSIRELRRILSSAKRAGEFGEVTFTDDGTLIGPAVSGRVWVAWARLNGINPSNVLELAVEGLEKQGVLNDLVEWLEFDTWTKKEFACLSCDINPTGADINWHGYRNATGVTIDKPRIANAQLLSEDPFFYITPTEQITQEEYDEVAFELAARGANVSAKQVDHSNLIEEKRRKIVSAEAKLQKVWSIMCRATDLKLEMPDRSSPKSFIQWAQKRNIEIPWLDWAMSNDLIKSAKADELGVTEEPLRVAPSDTRKQEGSQAAIEILNQKHANGELNDRHDFEQCMKKSEIIAFIRANPAEYPNCNKTKPKLNNDQAQTIKEREPTLTRSLLDFTKDPTILAEYERLTNSD